MTSAISRVRLRLFARLGLAALLVACSGSDVEPPEKSIEEAASDIATIFERTLEAAAPEDGLSEFDARCPHLLSRGPMKEFLGASARRQISEARKALVAVHAQLSCISARRFQAVHQAFRKALDEVVPRTEDDRWRELGQIAAPIVFVFFDLGGAWFREADRAWLWAHSVSLKEALEEEGSWLREIGLHASVGTGLAALSGEESLRLLDNLHDPGWASGRCQTIDLVAVASENEDRDVTLLCPEDCALGRWEERAPGQPGFLDPESREVCRRFREEKERLSASPTQAGVKACLDQFTEGQRGLMVCVGNRARQRRRERFFGIGSGSEPNLEESLLVHRQCRVSHGGHGYGSEVLVVANGPSTAEGAQSYSTTMEYYDAEGNHVSTYDRIVYRNEDGDVEKVVFERRDHEGNGSRTVTEYGEDGSVTSREEKIDPDDPRTVDPETLCTVCNQPEDGEDGEEAPTGGEVQCAPDSGHCDEGCGIRDQNAADLQECWETANPEDGLPTGPHPNLLMPDPRDGSPGSAASDLATCLVEALSPTANEGVPENDCAAYLRCANGEIPRGERCTCLPEQRVREWPELCNRILCDPTMPVCPCERPPTEGGEGGGPPPRPGGVIDPERPLPEIEWLGRIRRIPGGASNM